MKTALCCSKIWRRGWVGFGVQGSEGANKVYYGKCASSEFFSQIVSPCVGKFQKSTWNNISPIGQTQFQFVKNNMENSGIFKAFYSKKGFEEAQHFPCFWLNWSFHTRPIFENLSILPIDDLNNEAIALSAFNFFTKALPITFKDFFQVK